MAVSETESLVQYYVAERGRLSDGALALLAARGALLGHRRWRGGPSYARWHLRIMTKVVLAGTADELAALRAGEPEAGLLALDEAGQPVTLDTPAALLVFTPRPRAAAGSTLAGLRLAPKRHGASPTPDVRPLALLVAAGDLGMHGGKLAAQCAHAVLLGQSVYPARPDWARWCAADLPMALRRADSTTLAGLAERFPAGAVRDAGHTQVAAGSLTVVMLPPGSTVGDDLVATLAPW